MRVLLDTNIILDLFLEREAFVDDAALLWKANETGHFTAYVSAITPVNLFYIGRKLKGREAAFRAVQEVVSALSIAPINQLVLDHSLKLDFKDYEDAVQHASATAVNLEAIITRNIDDYKKAQIPVFSPDDFIKRHQNIFEELADELNKD